MIGTSMRSYVSATCKSSWEDAKSKFCTWRFLLRLEAVFQWPKQEGSSQENNSWNYTNSHTHSLWSKFLGVVSRMFPPLMCVHTCMHTKSSPIESFSSIAGALPGWNHWNTLTDLIDSQGHFREYYIMNQSLSFSSTLGVKRKGKREKVY